MADGLPPLIAVLRANNSQFLASMKESAAATKKVTDETGKTSTVAKSNFEKMAGAGKAMAVGIVGAGALVGGAALKMGMDFQESMTTLVTGAGESEKNIGMVGDGILNMAGKVGMSSDQLAKGMYLIESAGYHGSQGLNVLKAAAEGARVGNADMKTVADGLTTALTDYHLPASRAADVTSKLVETVASGKTTMGDLAGSLATVLPIASTAKVGLDQVLGAMATMTAKGTPAADAATYLKQTIAQLSNPTTKAAGEMKALGLSSIDVSNNLGKRGLTGTMDLLTSAIASKMGPQGTVLIDTLKKAAKSSGGLQSAISKLPPTQQTYVAALADMVGGTKSMQAALMLTGASAQTFKDNVHNIGKASTEAGGHVQGFGATQKDLKTQLENAKAGVEAMVTKLGLALIPIVEKVLGVAEKWGNWLGDHKAVLYAVAGVIGGVVVTAITAYVASLVKAGAESVAQFAKMVASVVEWAAKGAVAFAGWIAEHVAMAAAAVVQYGIMAAAATAAFVAENAASLGIGLAIAAIVAGVVWLATHWQQAWDAIKNAAKWAYDNVIKPVADWIMGNVIHPIGSAVSDLGDIWGRIWNGIKGVINDVGKVIGSVLNGIIGTINNVIGAVKTVIGWFEHLFSSANSANTAASKAAAAGAAAGRTGAVNMGSGTILGALSTAPHYDAKVAAAVAGQQGSGTAPSPAAAGTGTTINNYVTAQTNADPHRIASDIGWKLLAMA